MTPRKYMMIATGTLNGEKQFQVAHFNSEPTDITTIEGMPRVVSEAIQELIKLCKTGGDPTQQIDMMTITIVPTTRG